MCGIAGWVALSARAARPERRALVRMVRALHHRGPDDRGVYLDARAGLGHARLSIVDIAAGQQPMATADERLWVVYNGEIYNHVELRAELEALGHGFRTRSDTEVLLAAWARWGEGALDRMNGQWAFALWDAVEERLVLARDRVGIRPLHYSEHRGRLVFASEVKALFAGDPELERAFDPRGVAQTFTFWSALPPTTPFAGVRELEPGHLRVYQGGRVSDRAWWQPTFPDLGGAGAGRSFEAAAADVGAALEAASTLRMVRSDVPVGSYLSGGLDSSLVAALARRTVGPSFRTFSLRFEDAEFDETAHQRSVAARLGTEHHELVVTRRDIARVFPDVVRHAERPILRTAPAPLFLLSRLVRDVGGKVVLTGEGADEVFAGYDLFREGRVRRLWARHPAAREQGALIDQLYPYLERSPVRHRSMALAFFGRDLHRWAEPGFAHLTRWQTTGALQRLLSADIAAATAGFDPTSELLATLPAGFARWSFLAQDQYLELRTLLAGYLLSSQGDRMLMAHSVEGRFPFLDPDVMSLAFALPDRARLCGLGEKHVLKRVGAPLLPPGVVRRPKQPYRAPDALCFVGPDAPEWVRDALEPPAVRRAGLFDPGAVERLHRKCAARAGAGQLSNSDNMALVGVLSAQLLSAQLVEAGPAAPTAGAGEDTPAIRIIDRRRRAA